MRPAGKPGLSPHPSCSHDPLGQKPAAPGNQSKPGQSRWGRWKPGTLECWDRLQPSPRAQVYPVMVRGCEAWIISQRDGARVETQGLNYPKQRELSGDEERREELERGPIFHSQDPSSLGPSNYHTEYSCGLLNPKSPANTSVALALAERALGGKSEERSSRLSSPMI